jgi:putative transposase
MPIIVEVRKTYKYHLYRNDKVDQSLHDAINIAGIIWNHITELRKRYYRLFGKHLNSSRLKAHVAKLQMKTERFRYGTETAHV